MSEVVILSARRSPIGAFGGAFAELPVTELAGQTLKATVESAAIEPSHIGQVNMGCVLPAGIGQAPARQVALAAGCPPATGALTLNKVCGSGMRAVMLASNDLRAGDYDLAAAGGMESMSRAPHLLPGSRKGLRLGNAQLIDSVVHDGLWDPYNDFHMGNCAEICASHYDFSREVQDGYALESYQRARRATEEGAFSAEIAPIRVAGRRGSETIVERDEDPFRVDLDRMTSLRPAFKTDGSVTAANASNIDDGAATLILSTAERARELGLTPLARVLAHASHAQEPEWFTTAPIGAIRSVLARASLAVEDIDLWEINEAFAVVVLACMKELELSDDRVNVHGGAIALGHPIGCSGARILVTLLHAMQRRGDRLGCAAICIGGGEATAIVVESLA
jgi:acetyl-CoA C-acetyltransferase